MGPQRPGQHPWDVRCIDATTLARVAHPLPTRKGPPILGYPWHFKGASAACARRQRLLLHVIACLGPAGTRPAPLRRALHRCHDACTCGAPLTHQKRPTNFRLPLALQGRVSRLHPKAETAAACHSMPWPSRDPASILGTCAASMPRRLHVWRTPYPLEKAHQFQATLGTSRARQPPAPEGRDCCCMS